LTKGAAKIIENIKALGPPSPKVVCLHWLALILSDHQVSNFQNMLAADFQKSQRVQDHEAETGALEKENSARQGPCPAKVQPQWGWPNHLQVAELPQWTGHLRFPGLAHPSFVGDMQIAWNHQHSSSAPYPGEACKQIAQTHQPIDDKAQTAWIHHCLVDLGLSRTHP
jgi:hypothetical protein